MVVKNDAVNFSEHFQGIELCVILSSHIFFCKIFQTVYARGKTVREGGED